MLVTFAHKRGALGYRLVNDGARSYVVSRDGRTYTFHLRPGMKLSDGSGLAAPSYKHALLRILHPDVDSSLASLFTDPATVNIVGASDYNAGRTSTVPGIRTRGPYTLIIELASPSPLLCEHPASERRALLHPGVQAGPHDQDPEEPLLPPARSSAHAWLWGWVRLRHRRPARPGAAAHQEGLGRLGSRRPPAGVPGTRSSTSTGRGAGPACSRPR